jgi:hypothetical protein
MWDGRYLEVQQNSVVVLDVALGLQPENLAELRVAEEVPVGQQLFGEGGVAPGFAPQTPHAHELW